KVARYVTFSGGVASFFFFQAEDGIRDLYVTGVQTCALPIYGRLPPGRWYPEFEFLSRREPCRREPCRREPLTGCARLSRLTPLLDRKSTRLNSSHVEISYAVFCLKKKTPTHPTVARGEIAGF